MVNSNFKTVINQNKMYSQNLIKMNLKSSQEVKEVTVIAQNIIIIDN
jgi:hypothetical protein